MLIGEKFATACQNVFTLIAGLVIAFVYCWPLALLVMGVLPCLAVVFFAFSGTLTEQTQLASDGLDTAGLTARESLSAIRTLFALNGEKKEVNKYKSQLLVAEKAGISKAFAGSWMAGCTAGVMWCIYALGLWFGAFLIKNSMQLYQRCSYYTLPNGLQARYNMYVHIFSLMHLFAIIYFLSLYIYMYIYIYIFIYMSFLLTA
jgi:ABC-type bacteriocin/lantibiotic exporter with double-glycine peptidase domain